MYIIITKVTYEYAHRLMLHRGKCRYLHGHSGEVTVELSAEELNGNGFVMDFGEVKRQLKTWINKHWDHAYLANENDPLLPALEAEGMKIFTFLDEPTAEVMAQYLFNHVSTMQLRAGVTVSRVIVQETCTGVAIYQTTSSDYEETCEI